MKPLYKIFLLASLVLLMGGVIFFLLDHFYWAKISFISCMVLLALSSNGNTVFKRFTFGLWILSAVSLAMSFPDLMTTWGNFNTKSLIIPLMQVIMFGVGSAMSLKDFGEIIKSPKAVLIGLVCQFTIMPFVGLALAMGFGFPPEIAAGIILIGSSPSGLASNVMAYISKANLALSVTLTLVATLLAPFVTPLLMKVLAGQLVPIDAGAMMWGIVKIVILPIIAGLIFNKVLHGKTKWLDEAMPKLSMVGIAVIVAVITASGRDGLMEIGVALVIAALIHNCGGYALGYWICKIFKMDEKSCRTIALEVGLQNGGLASGIALQMGKVATVGLASAVFGPMMNITGSMLASWWKEKPCE